MIFLFQLLCFSILKFLIGVLFKSSTSLPRLSIFSFLLGMFAIAHQSISIVAALKSLSVITSAFSQLWHLLVVTFHLV